MRRGNSRQRVFALWGAKSDRLLAGGLARRWWKRATCLQDSISQCPTLRLAPLHSDASFYRQSSHWISGSQENEVK